MKTLPEPLIAISPATRSDCADVALLLKQSNLPISDIDVDLKGFLVAKQDGKLLGTVAVETFGANGLLRSLAVDLSRRNSGLGSRLYQEALRMAASCKIKTLYLLTITAAGYFSAKGFIRIKRDEACEAIQQHEQFKFLCPESAILMKKNINNTSIR